MSASNQAKSQKSKEFPPVVFTIGGKPATKEEVIAHIKNKYGEVSRK
ncbi:MAG: hypothetical protein Q8876_08200 [Bacillota bacterium]|nr:hypothetical protein [Bacillota bacterium]